MLTPNWENVLAVVGTVAEVDHLDALGPAVLRALGQVIAYDVASYNELDPETDRAFVVSQPEDEIERWPSAAQAFPRLSHQNPLVAHQAETGDGSARRISDFLSLDELYALDLYQEVYRVVGVRYQMAIGLPTRPPRVIGIAISRADHDFTDSEVALLDALRPYLIQAYRNVRTLAELAGIDGALELEGRATVVLGSGHDEARISEPAARLLADHFGQPAGGTLPPAVRDWLEAQRGPPGPAGQLHIRQPLVEERRNRRLVVRFIPGAGARPDVLILEQRWAERETARLRALGLTTREAEILLCLTKGLTTGKAAEELGMSGATVAKHLERVYRKMGVTNRVAAIAAASDILS